MTYSINDTSDYHINGMDTLGWELTVCNALESRNSPLVNILARDATLGIHLYDFLQTRIDPGSVCRVLETGGGYGFVMRDFLVKNPGLQSVMLDISPWLLEQQKKTLSGKNVNFIEKDFFQCDPGFFRDFDMVLLNEVAGDFPAVTGLSSSLLTKDTQDPVINRIRELCLKYDLPVHGQGEFTFNLGAIEAVERLCTAGIKYIYLSEHSCEGSPGGSYSDIVRVSFPGVPEKIQLRGHYEYTLKFSSLKRIAEKLGYSVIRGNYTDIIPLQDSPRIRFILTSNTQNDEHEIIRHFVEDLYKYEYLFMIRD